MKVRFESSPREVATMSTAMLREQFLVGEIFKEGEINWVYSHYDRVMIGGAIPLGNSIALQSFEGLKATYFLERRELGIINIGGNGSVVVDGQRMDIQKLGCVYVGRGSKEVVFESVNSEDPAVYYLLSAPAHASYPTRHYSKEDAAPATVGSQETSNLRTIYKYIHQEGLQSCQLVMGLTVLSPGSVWNTMPAHVHDRRMEAYCYFDVAEGQRVMHLMGEPSETRHIWVENRQAVISPPWSIHSGCGTSNYSFIWGMAGENKDYTDMDMVAIPDLR
ncbi:4-deoxy-L-threo-5-hexosulose-uronate ketol-isomerase [Dyadobacter jejuensis]|uniref:4-deoxy-L-threo-5-hexosulose-uronate ketol-isomerase n=1 Tax=Dyadobacter jejuensis TaxID=1082580 RepID=A0A316B3V3_9BACT|nr:5-dehydro-4-deoxy-D-glucuronate isomerase [Dyadobacter jejuensis]PWJ57247.1 4-deoxy-L-threo-5-hexosulose-uronate ketol-isomerase [Dyadobacter jejuensis]